MPALASKGSQCLKDLWPNPVDDLTHRGRPKPRLQQLEPLEGVRMEPNRPLVEAEKGPPRTGEGRHPPQARVESHPPQAKAERPQARVESHPPQAKAERHPPPARAVNRPPQAEMRNQPPREALLTHPWRGKERAMVPGPTGTKGPYMGPKVEPLSPKGLPIRSGRCRRCGWPSDKFTTAWMVKTHPRTISPLRPCRHTTLELIPRH